MRVDAISTVLVTVAVLSLVLPLAFASRWAFVVVEPDEWLLRVRNGRLVDAGIGISLFRWPGDVVVRFSSTVQRVKFAVGARTLEQLPVSIEGFVLWSVSATEGSPLRAFSRLGIANLDRPPSELKNKKHLLTGAQYHAFQALLAAEVQRHAATLELKQLLVQQEEMAKGLVVG